MTIRAMRLLASVEKGATAGEALQSALDGDLSLKQELLHLLGINSFAKRAELSNEVMTALALSNHAMDAMTAHSYIMGLIGTAAGRRSHDILVEQSPGMAKLLQYIAGLDPYTYDDMPALVSAPAALSAVLGSATTRTKTFDYSVSTNAVYTVAAANNTVIGTPSSVGQYLDRLRQINGLATDAALDAAADIATIATSASLCAAVANSALALDSVSKSANGRAAITTASAGFIASFTSAMAMAKYAAGLAGLDPATFTTMAHLGASNVAIDAAFADSGWMTQLFAVPARMDELFASAAFRAYIGTSGAKYDQILANETAHAKYIGGHAGIDMSGVTSYATLFVAGNATGIGNSNSAMDCIVPVNGNYNAQNALTSTFMDALLQVANCQTHMINGFGVAMSFFTEIIADNSGWINKATAALAGLTSTSTYTSTASSINSTTYVNAVFSSVNAKTAGFWSENWLDLLTGNSTLENNIRAHAATSIISWTENGTTDVSLSGQLPGAKYICIGNSRSTSTARTVTFGTLRSGTANTAPAATSGTGNTAANDANFDGIPLVGPYTARLSNSGTGTSYATMIRVDAPTFAE